jgi:hypothetical protein
MVNATRMAMPHSNAARISRRVLTPPRYGPVQSPASTPGTVARLPCAMMSFTPSR